MEFFKNKKFWIHIAFATVIMIALGKWTSFVFLFACFGIWYFNKRNPNQMLRAYSTAFAIISFFVIGVTGTSAEAPDPVPDDQVAMVERERESEETDPAAVAESIRIKEEQEKKAKAEAESKRKKTESESLAKKEKKKAELESIAKAESESRIKAEEAEKEQERAEINKKIESTHVSPPVMDWSQTYVEVNDNIPLFTNEDISSTEAWESYGALDELGRVTVANAVLGVELMPAEERGDISDIRPSGWNQAEYSVVPGGWLYNRSHLIGHQLTGQDANPYNLMTGTRWFNSEGMLPFENFVANFIEETEYHVRYRVTPYFEGDNLLASGVFMEGMSIEDNGAGLMFHIYVPNVQPEVNLDYATGLSWVDAPVVEVVEVPVIEETPVVEEVPVVVEEPVQVPVYYKNCTAAREAGAAPVHREDPGYGKHLDRDGDGIGCE